MKAKQLMVGDLIYTRDINAKNYIRITAIDGVANFIRGIYINNNEDTGWFSCDLAYEIKITAEILKVNGIDINRPFCFPGNYNIELSFDNNKLYWTINYFEYEVLPLTYIHELQHALRLCGLNKLADNFKLPQL